MVLQLLKKRYLRKINFYQYNTKGGLDRFVFILQYKIICRELVFGTKYRYVAFKKIGQSHRKTKAGNPLPLFPFWHMTLEKIKIREYTLKRNDFIVPTNKELISQ